MVNLPFVINLNFSRAVEGKNILKLPLPTLAILTVILSEYPLTVSPDLPWLSAPLADPGGGNPAMPPKAQEGGPSCRLAPQKLPIFSIVKFDSS